MTMMECGHAANATSNGKPSCVICAGINEPAAHTVAKEPHLTGRIAKCSYGCKPVPSAVGLAFFEYRPKETEDRYYCGCRGWD